MKIGIIGAGNVGKACAMATIMRGCTRELVLLDKNEEHALQNGIDVLKKSLQSIK